MFNVNGTDDIVDVSGFEVNVGGVKIASLRAGGKPQKQPNNMGINLHNAFAMLDCADKEDASVGGVPRPAGSAKYVGGAGVPRIPQKRRGKGTGAKASPALQRDHDEMNGVRGGLALPAEEAEPAETPAVERIRINREQLRANDRIFSGMYKAVNGGINMFEEDVDTGEINAIRDKIVIKVVMDSGAVKTVTHSDTPPSTVKVMPHKSGKHFSV